MPSPTPQLRSARDPREDILFSELELAVRWNRPSILFAVYDSHVTRRKVSRRLGRRLKRIGQRVCDFRITTGRADVPLALRDHPRRETTVFMVWGLQQAESVFREKPYKPLNIRREILVESRIRAIFWLTEREAIDLARQAPDFWAFRHRVVDFLDPFVAGLASDWMAHAYSAASGGEDLRAKIAYREQLLLDESGQDWMLAFSLRLSLGRLYGAESDFAQARAHLEAAAALASAAGDAARHGEALIALGGVMERARQFDAAEAAYRQAGGVNPASAIPHMRLSMLALARGQFETAQTLARQCVETFPQDEHAWTYLGWLLGRLGNLQEAMLCCRQALDLNANNARAWWLVGMLHSMEGAPDEALFALQRSCALDGTESRYWHSLAVEWDAQGQTGSALSCARRAVRVNAQNAEAWLGLGGLLQARRRLKSAVACYMRAFALSGQDSTLAALACASLSMAWREKRDQQLAEHWQAQACDRLFTAEALGQAACYALCGDAASAQDAMQRAKAFDWWQAHLFRNLPVFLKSSISRSL